MGTAVLIGQQRLVEKRSNIQLSTPIDIMPFRSSLFPSSPLLLLLLFLPLSLSPYTYFSTGRISEVRRVEQINMLVCVCVCVCYLKVEEFFYILCLSLLFVYRPSFIQISIVCVFQHLHKRCLIFGGNCVNSTSVHQEMITI